ncbi:hypothetical protein K2F40_03765 [Clostridium sp. CM028]|nr:MULTISPECIES: hypothetical protein [unclassified Clostridium]MBU3092717.1 hypothetical protein [Clostridium sp. CF011]MBW9148094.1 hypothetical protein [Clostridium sp. CM028]WLC62213.1 hypothetical protein KTC94_02710 [Clostridium sp. CM028]
MLDINKSSISDVFGWTCSPVWRKFALDNNGIFEKGNIIKEQSIKIKNLEGYICYKAFRRANDKRGMNTQITASYITKGNFVFKSRIKGSIYTPFVNFNKLENAKIDNEIFNKFIIKTNNKNALAELFKDDEIISLISSQDLFCMEIRKGKKFNEKVLYIEINGIVDNYKKMEQTFNLTIKIINYIQKI